MNEHSLENHLYQYGYMAADYMHAPETLAPEHQIGRAEMRGVLVMLSLILEAEEHGFTEEGFKKLHNLIDDAGESGFLGNNG
jgi:hypothetical protein